MDRGLLRRARLHRRRRRRGSGVMRGRRTALAALAVALIATLAACTNDPLADQYRSGDNKGYIAGDFRVVEIPVADRTDPVDFTGKTEAGDAVSSADYAGK